MVPGASWESNKSVSRMQGSELEGIDCVDDGVCYIAKLKIHFAESGMGGG